MKKIFLTLLLLGASFLQAADNPIQINRDPIHEAFISRKGDLKPLEVVPKQPPAPIAETPPAQPNPQTIWIPGYWSWIREKQDFVWICGVWRLPPPDRIWSPGAWKEVKGGWVYTQGAWMPNQAKGPWVYAKTPPPASQNENTGNSPGADYFWFSGYWNYVTATNKFEWLAGSWQKFDPNMILEPAYWIWRPEGYLFVSTYWDWTLDARGVAYNCKNQKPIEPKELAQQMSCCLPDYSAECCHSYHFEPEIWQDCGCVPAWWDWSDWWALPSGDSWWLWWWWLNSDDYPYPPFLPPEIIDVIPPPDIIIIDTFEPYPPIFVIPDGVPTLIDWIDAINTVLGGDNSLIPLLPPNKIDTIIDTVDKSFPKTGFKKPKGKKDHNKHPPKPNSTHPLTPPSGQAAMPPHPGNQPQPPTPPQTAPIPPNPGLIPPPMVHPQEPIPATGFAPQPIPVPTGPVVTYPPDHGGGYYGGYYGGGYYGGSYGSYWGGGYNHDGGHWGGHDGGGHWGGHQGGHWGGHQGGHQGGHWGGHQGGGYHGGGHHGGGHHGGGHHGGGGGRHHANADENSKTEDKDVVADLKEPTDGVKHHDTPLKEESK